MTNDEMPRSATDGRVQMLFGSLTRDQVDGLKALGGRLRRQRVTPGTAGLREFVVAANEQTDFPLLAAGYGLAASALNVNKTMKQIASIDNGEEVALDALKPADLLFHWEDDDRSVADRGSAIGELSIIPMDRDAAGKLRELTAILVADHLLGLAEMARGAGYYREAMALAHTATGEPVLLIYLEMVDGRMRERLHSLPVTEFMRWWGPRFLALVDVPKAGPTTNLIRCTIAE